MRGRIEHYGPGAADQFKAEMNNTDNPWNIAFARTKQGYVVAFQQGNPQSGLFFPDPEALREFAQVCIQAADVWEADLKKGA